MPSDLNGDNGLPPSDGGVAPWSTEQSGEGEIEEAAPVSDNQRFLSVGLRFFEKMKDIS